MTSLLGFEDIFASRVVAPSLSTINQFRRELGRVAAEMVFERIMELPRDTPGRRREAPFEIVRRQSV